jgi:hypothetical protein
VRCALGGASALQGCTKSFCFSEIIFLGTFLNRQVDINGTQDMPAVRRRTRAAPGAEAKAISDPEAKLAALVEELELEGAPHTLCALPQACSGAVGVSAEAACRRVRACTDTIVSAVESKCTILQSEAERMATTVRYALRRSPRAIAPARFTAAGTHAPKSS